MPPSLILSPEMGTEIVRHLSQFADLPRKGILAGQAVDSAITDLWLKGGGVYNDLDIFRQCPTKSDRPRKKVNQTAMRSALKTRALQSYGGMALVMETIDTYGIASVSQTGLLNYVNCFMASGRYGERLSAQRVLSGFDINCVRVGVDLETGLLHWDRQYQEFLGSRQLKISMMHTPWHTFLRLVKKLDELPGVYADVELTAQACSAVARSQFVGQLLKDRDVSLLFGVKHLELARRYASTLAPYFALEPSNFLRKGPQSWSEARISAPNEVAQTKERDRLTLWQMRPRGTLDAGAQERVDRLGKGAIFFAYQSIEEARRKKSSQVCLKLETLRAHRVAQLEGEGARLSRAYAFEPVATAKVLAHLTLFGTAYVTGQALPAVSDKVEAFFAKHTAFSDLMLGLPVSRQWETIQRIQKLTQRFAHEFAVEGTQTSLGVLETQALPADLADDEVLWSFLVEDHRRQTQSLGITALALPQIPARWSNLVVEELLTALALRAEGARMNHCVGGYAQAIRSGRSRIFSIRHCSDKSARSTVELHVCSKKGALQIKVKLAQHRTSSNKTPTAEQSALVAYLVAAINLPETARAGLLRTL